MPNHLVLSIDDDPFYRDLYRNIFEPKGFEFMSALDPAEGYAAVKEKKPAIILLDVMMPEKKGFQDGFGLLEEFRRMPDLKSTPILMVSALGDESDVRHGLDLGATDYLPKQDMTPDRLLKKVASLLGAAAKK
jgi:DNA-binding response OmpR family regulator